MEVRCASAMEGGQGKKNKNKNKGKCAGGAAVLPPYLGGDFGGAAPDLNAAFTRVKEARERLDRALDMKNGATSLTRTTCWRRPCCGRRRWTS
jgi:hypothetical protein